MKKIFWAKIILTFAISFTLTKVVDYDMNGVETIISSTSILILPPFIGWIMFYQGALEMESYSERFESLKKWLIALTVYTSIAFVLKLFINNELAPFQLLDLIFMIISIYCDYLLFKGIIDTENVIGRYMRGDKLMRKFVLTFVLGAATVASVFLALISVSLLLVTFGIIIAGLVNSILILVDLYNAENTFTDYLLNHDDEIIIEIQD